MKKALIKTLLPSFLLALLLCAPVFAECADGQVDTNLFGCVDSENGSQFILNIVYTVLTFGVGIAGTVGIVIAGIQYSTAKDNEQQMAKAKMRIVQIVIGMAIWAFLFVFLRFILPGFTGGDLPKSQ